MSTNSIVFYLVCLLIFIKGISTKKIFLKHDQNLGQQKIFKFFYDKNDGYYVDIGGYDPIFISTSINLYARGWDGLNIEAHPVRFSAFPQIKSEDVSINIAGDETQKYVTFYQYQNDGSQSTTILDVSENLKKRGKNMTQLQIPAMNMKQLCQRYFKKKPNYMNIDIQGVTTKLLNSNDWNNPKCRPQIIFPELDNLPNSADIWETSHKEYLEGKGYTFIQKFNANQVFIENTVYQYYMDKYKKGSQVLAQMSIVESKQQLIALYQTIGATDLGKFSQVAYRSNIHNGNFYYFYPKQGSIFCLEDINRRSNRFATQKNRPILIEMFNPQNTHYIINSKQYTREDVVVNNLVYDKITITKENGQTFVTYIFNIDTQAYKAYVAKNENKSQNIKLFLTILIFAGISATLTYIILRRKFKKMQKQVKYSNSQQQMSAHEAN